MAFISDFCLDAALANAGSATRLVVCSQMPTSFAEANSTYMLGHKDAPKISAVGDGTPNGRAISVSAIADGIADASGGASHFALVDVTNSRLLVAQALASTVTLAAGINWTLTAFTVRMPDAA